MDELNHDFQALALEGRAMGEVREQLIYELHSQYEASTVSKQHCMRRIGLAWAFIWTWDHAVDWERKNSVGPAITGFAAENTVYTRI